MAAVFDRRAIPKAAHESRWALPDGQEIRRIAFDPASDKPVRGSLLFMPGRGDFYEKYLESLEYWAAQGWQVSAADWRGQGASGRMTADPLVGDIADFSVWSQTLPRCGATGPRRTPGRMCWWAIRWAGIWQCARSPNLR